MDKNCILVDFKGSGSGGDRCPVCGRVSQDWGGQDKKALSSSGAKARQRSDTEDRTVAYKDWHRKLGKSLYVCDVDQIEFRVRGGKVVPVAVLELTRVDDELVNPKAYLRSIQARYRRDGQELTIVEIARRIGVPAWIVAFRSTLEDFWMCNLADGKWYHKSQEQYAKWLGGL